MQLHKRIEREECEAGEDDEVEVKKTEKSMVDSDVDRTREKAMSKEMGK